MRTFGTATLRGREWVISAEPHVSPTMPRDAAAARQVAHFALPQIRRALERAIDARNRSLLPTGAGPSQSTKADARWADACKEVNRLIAVRNEALRMIEERGDT